MWFLFTFKLHGTSHLNALKTAIWYCCNVFILIMQINPFVTFKRIFSRPIDLDLISHSWHLKYCAIIHQRRHVKINPLVGWVETVEKSCDCATLTAITDSYYGSQFLNPFALICFCLRFLPQKHMHIIPSDIISILQLKWKCKIDKMRNEHKLKLIVW